jgi:hypothetical protein
MLKQLGTRREPQHEREIINDHARENDDPDILKFMDSGSRELRQLARNDV